MTGLAAQFAARNEQWDRFHAWQRHEDPARLIDREDGFRWACEMHEWYVARFGYSKQSAHPRDFDGVRLMRSRLALLTTRV